MLIYGRKKKKQRERGKSKRRGTTENRQLETNRQHFSHVVEECSEVDVVYRCGELLVLLVFVVPPAQVFVDRHLKQQGTGREGGREGGRGRGVRFG